MPRSRRLSDATLVRRSQQGDRRAFTALLTRYDWRLRGLAHALLLDPAEMDAALGVGYLRAWRDVVRISPSDNVAAWLYRVVYNACIDQLRLADGAASQSAATASPTGGVATGLAALPAAERVVVVLVDREGFSPTSAARIMGLSPDAVTSTLDRARATLTEHVPAAPPAAKVPEPPAAGPVPAPVADPEPVGCASEASDSPAVADPAPVTDSPAVGGAAAVDGAEAANSPGVGDGAPVGGASAPAGGATPVGPAPAVADPAAVTSSAAVGGEFAETRAPDGDEPDDTDGFEDHGPIDHEAVADAVVAEASADDGDPDEPQESGDAQGSASESDGGSGIAQESDGLQREPHESDGASVGGNGNGAAGRNGHAANSGRGRRSRRRAKHAAAQQRPDGNGPAGDGPA